MDISLRVMIVEDSEEDALLVERELRRGSFAPTCLRVDTAEAMRQTLGSAKWDVIIADYSMPHFSGMAAFQIYKEEGLDIPFILVSGTVGEDVAVAAMKTGIHDYVMKGNLVRLVPAIQRELRDAAERLARRKAEEQLKQTERLRLVGELTSSLIHDLKNPLQSILGSSEILNSDSITPEKRVKYCRLIERQVQRVNAMADDVLGFVEGYPSLSLKPVDPAALVREVVDTYSLAFAKEGVTMTYTLAGADPPLPIAICDEHRVFRALQNLIANAKDAMPQGGQIRLQVSAAESLVTFEISDTGGGIPESIRDRLFEPFVTHGKRYGTGLGLAIVKRIVEAHGGSITFTTEQGRGTTFRISLPTKPPIGIPGGVPAAAVFS